MKTSTLSLVASTPQSLVPADSREAVRKIFDLPDPMPISEILNKEEFKTLQEEFNAEAEGEILDPIDLSIYRQIPSSFNLKEAWIDYVEQRERLPDHNYRKGIIQLALKFNARHAGIPMLSIPVDAEESEQHKYLLDWQKRCLALALRGVYEYPCVIVETTKAEMAKDFGSQFKLKDRMQEYDKFKAALAEQSPKHWAMQHCFDRLGVSAYPFGNPPQITGLGDISKAMFDPSLNNSEKNSSFEEKKFQNFVRAVSIHRRVWPELSKTSIQGSWIRGMVAIIASFDTNVLKGTDDWIITILEEAKNPDYDLYKEGPPGEMVSVGLKNPIDWTTKADWHGNKHHQKAITTFARAWNKIRNSAKLRRTIPMLNENPIIGIENGAKMLDMKSEE
jgi:hypothetical protein